MLTNSLRLSPPTFAILILISVVSTISNPFACFAATGEDPKHIIFIRYNLKEKQTSAVIDGFKNTMTRKGYIEGKNIIYSDFVTHLPEHKSADTVLDYVDKHLTSADLFVTSSWTSIYARSKLAKTKTPQLFAPALRSTVLSMLSFSDAEPETNLSGVYLEFPPENILQLAVRILPKIRKYAFVYDSRIPADIAFKSAYGQLNKSERHGLTIYFLDLANGTDTVLQKMKKMGVEGFGGGVGVLQNLKDLSQSQLPIITALLIDRNTRSLINLIKNSGIVAGLFSPFDQCGKQAAEMAVDIFEKNVPIENMTPQPARQLTVVNLVAAKRLNQSVPFSALETADLVIR